MASGWRVFADNPEALAFTLKTIKLLDDRLANPATA
jgi:hypothetical protein